MRNRTQNYAEIMSLLYTEESFIIRGTAFDIYKKFRNRYKEKIYQNAFILGLVARGLRVEKEKRIDVFYQDKKVGTYMPDLVVNNNIFIELKAKPALIDEDIKQFWHYLKGSDFKLGFLINFGAPDGVEIIRKVYDAARKK